MRSRAAWLLLPGAAAVLAGIQLRALPAPALAWSLFLIVALPVLTIAQARGLHELDPFPRRAAYVSTIISLWVLALVTLGVARWSGLDRGFLGLVPLPLATTALWTAGLTAAGVGVLFGFRALGMREPELMHRLMPRDAGDRALFVAVSVTAGISEELVFRGFLLSALHLATDSVAIALVVSSGAFGVVHAYQQLGGAARAALLGAILAAPVVYTGSILPALLAHALIDVLSGLWLHRWLLRPR